MKLFKLFLIVFCLFISSTVQADLGALLRKVTGSNLPNKTVVILLDVSSSIAPTDRVLYENSFNAVLQSLNTGDRLVLAKLGDSGRSRFLVAANVNMASTGISYKDKQALQQWRLSLLQQFKQLNQSIETKGRATLIMDAITASAEVFKTMRTEQGYLVLLSDMVEQSNQLNFAKTRPDANMISKVEVMQLLPSLNHVTVLVCGASGKYFNEALVFWQAYFAKTGAVLKHYGRLGLDISWFLEG